MRQTGPVADSARMPCARRAGITPATNFVKESFENSTQHARMFSELISGFPSEISKSYQEAWLKAVNAAAQATQEASQTAAENVKSFSEAARKSSNAFERRESA
jgi:hypothetical protein